MAANRYCLLECEYFFTVGNFHIDPGHIHKASAVVAVVAQAVWACIPHTAGLVLVDNWDTEVLDHSGRGLESIKMEKKTKHPKKPKKTPNQNQTNKQTKRKKIA